MKRIKMDMEQNPYPPVYLDREELDGDGQIRLDQLAKLIPTLQKRYGARAVIVFDAGYNNVSVKCYPTKEQK